MQRHGHRTNIACAVLILLTALGLTGASFALAIRPGPAAYMTPLPPRDPPDSPSVGYFIHDQASDGFYTYGNGCNFRLNRGGVTVIFPADVAYLEFLDANPDVRVVGRRQAQASASVYIGNDPAQWRRQAPMYSEIVYEALYPGIDLVVGLEDGQLRSEFRVQPEAQLSDIRIRSTGDASLSIEQEVLELGLALGSFLHERVSTGYQEVDHQRREVSVVFELLDEHT